MRWKCSAMIWRPERGMSPCTSATRPATEFSIGIMAWRASPSRTAAKTSSNASHASVAMSGWTTRQAASE